MIQTGLKTFKSQSGKDIAFDRYSMVLNGQRTFIRSGAMHYFRLPEVNLWRDRLFKLKAAGYNTVDLYFCWAYHSPAPGVYDFSGIRDVDKLLEITQELGLHLIGRPGPYINAEYTAGGLPGWLLADQEVILRNRLEDGSFQWSDKYMAAVTQWWGQIVPKLAKAENLIMMQIENEYASADLEPEYMQALYDISREMGITVPLMHNDLYAEGLYEDIVDIYAFDNYSVTSFESDWRQNPGVFGILDNVENKFRPFCANRPLMVAELQAGWFGTWKGDTYEHMIDSLGRDHISLSTKSLIGQGLTLYNHYKLIGCTNWGLTGSTDSYTSYDFAAPIAESGLNTERLYETKALNYFLGSFDLAATDKAESPVTCSAPELLYAVRASVDQPGAHWLFLRNMTPESRNLTLDRLSVEIKPYEFLILPHHAPLKNGQTLTYSNVEALYQTDRLLFLKGNRAVTFKIGEQEYTHPAVGEWEFAELQAPGDLENLKVFLLGEALVDRFWLDDTRINQRIVMGPDERLADGYGFNGVKREIIIIDTSGNVTRQEKSGLADIAPLPELSNWAFKDGTRADGFQPVSIHGADFDQIGLYEGTCWYRYPVPAGSKELKIDARHLWAAFFNGEHLTSGAHILLQPGQSSPPPVSVALPSTEGGELLLLVDGLGHPKGFHDDARVIEGLLLLEVDHRDVTKETTWAQGLNMHGLFDLITDPLTQKKPPIVLAETSFTLPETPQLHRPVGLDLADIKADRVNIYVNGILVGRHWADCARQNRYYLPEGVLKTGENRLMLALINFSADEISFKASQAKLFSYGEFTKIVV